MQTVCSFFYQHGHTANVNWNCRSSYAVKWIIRQFVLTTWWRHQMETISALLAFCAWNSPVTGEFPPEMPVTWRFDVFLEVCLNKRLRKQSRGWWFEMPSRSLWRHCNEFLLFGDIGLYQALVFYPMICGVFRCCFYKMICLSYSHTNFIVNIPTTVYCVGSYRYFNKLDMK